MGGSGDEGSEEATELSLSERVRSQLEAGGAARVHCASRRETEHADSAALGHKFGERKRRSNSSVVLVVTTTEELAVEELEHVVEAFGGGGGGRVIIRRSKAVAVGVGVGVESKAVGDGGDSGRSGRRVKRNEIIGVIHAHNHKFSNPNGRRDIQEMSMDY